MDFEISGLSDIFCVPAAIYSAEHLQNGHINKTFRILKDNKPQYILQRVNSDVFRDMGQLMSNYHLVSSKLSGYHWPVGISLNVPEIIPACDGKFYFTDRQGIHWRLITNIPGVTGDQAPRNKKTSYQGGLAFGAFLEGVSGIDPGTIHAVLPDFHSLEKRFGEFIRALETNSAGRAALISSEIEFVRHHHHEMMKIPDLLSTGVIPERIVHNDTKLTNVIFSENGTAAGVIDLDTVMVGSALFDFGDAIRSSANSAAEDEPDLDRVHFEIDFFETFATGYLKAAHSLLCKEEISLLPESAMLMTYIIGIRFLTDYLNGDIYFHTQFADHNLVRAKVQFRLLSLIESQITQMHGIIDQILSNLE